MNRAERRRMDRTNRQRLRQVLRELGPDRVFIIADAQAAGPPLFADDEDGACSCCGCGIWRRPWIPPGVNTLCDRCTRRAPHPITVLGQGVLWPRPAPDA